MGKLMGPHLKKKCSKHRSANGEEKNSGTGRTVKEIIAQNVQICGRVLILKYRKVRLNTNKTLLGTESQIKQTPQNNKTK